MDVSLAARFAAACRADRPLELVVERADGVVVAQGTLEQPFAVLGRESFCDIHLPDPNVGPRHAYLQVVFGRVFVTDLGSPDGLVWGGDRRPCGWLEPGVPVEVGPYRMYLCRPACDHPPPLPVGFHPLSAGELPAGVPPATIEFRNGKAARSAWDVDRAVTLVGRAKECKIQLTGDDVSLHHCALVRTPDGLWVADLFGRGGVRLDGASVRLVRLEHDQEIRVGRFRVGCLYPPPDDGRVSFDVPDDSKAVRRPRVRVTATPASFRLPPPRVPAATDLMLPADPLTLAGPTAVPPVATMAAPIDAVAPPPVVVHTTEIPPAATDQIPLDELQKNMFAQFQQALGQLHRDQMATVQQELTKVADLTAELTKLRAEAAMPIEPPRLIDTDPLPFAAKVTAESADRHGELWERMAALEGERQSVWQRVLGAFGGR